MSQKLVEDEIIKALRQLLEIEGFPVPQEQQVLPPGTRMTSPRSMRRHVYFHFACDKCYHRWTSSKGTCEVLFFIYNLREDIRENMSIKFHVRYFGQKCTRGCNSFIEPTMDQQENRQALAIQFAELVSRIINRIPKEQREKKQKRPLLKDHKQQLCEACSLGKCSYKIQSKEEHNTPPVMNPKPQKIQTIIIKPKEQPVPSIPRTNQFKTAAPNNPNLKDQTGQLAFGLIIFGLVTLGLITAVKLWRGK